MNLTIAAAGSVPNAGYPTAARTKAERAACDFEAVLLTSLLEKLQSTFSGIHEQDASASYGAMGTQALASALAARGGIGIAHMLLTQWRQTKVLK